MCPSLGSRTMLLPSGRGAVLRKMRCWLTAGSDGMVGSRWCVVASLGRNCNFESQWRMGARGSCRAVCHGACVRGCLAHPVCHGMPRCLSAAPHQTCSSSHGGRASKTGHIGTVLRRSLPWRVPLQSPLGRPSANRHVGLRPRARCLSTVPQFRIEIAREVHVYSAQLPMQAMELPGRYRGRGSASGQAGGRGWATGGSSVPRGPRGQHAGAQQGIAGGGASRWPQGLGHGTHWASHLLL